MIIVRIKELQYWYTMLKYNTVSCYGSWKYLDVAMIRLKCTTKCDVLWILYA